MSCIPCVYVYGFDFFSPKTSLEERKKNRSGEDEKKKRRSSVFSKFPSVRNSSRKKVKYSRFDGKRVKYSLLTEFEWIQMPMIARNSSCVDGT